MEVISFLEKVHHDMEDNIYNYTVNGKCSSCGNCCSRFLPLNNSEIKKLKKYIKMNHIKKQRHLIPLNTYAEDFICPLLNTSAGNKKCMVYDVRPMICKAFICDNAQRAKENRALIYNCREEFDMTELFEDER